MALKPPLQLVDRQAPGCFSEGKGGVRRGRGRASYGASRIPVRRDVCPAVVVGDLETLALRLRALFL